MVEHKFLLEASDLVKHYPLKASITSVLLRRKTGFVHALDGVSFSLDAKETLGVVGESGSGKTTLGLAVLRLLDLTSGKLVFEGTPITDISERQMKPFRRHMQVVFQDPSSSLDPRKTVVDSLTEPLRAYGEKNKSEKVDKASRVLREVGLEDSQLYLYPHQFSGGQRQRICIARAIIQEPKFIVLDEPTSSLDVSVQSQILLLLQRLQDNLNLTYLLITHNMIVAKYLSDRIAVMYLGEMVEIGGNEEITGNPLHPYTQELIGSVLEPGEIRDISKFHVTGEPPSAIDPPRGCRFNTRCLYARERCLIEEPKLRPIINDHYVACHFAGELVAQRQTNS